MKQKIFEWKRRRKTRLRRTPAKRPSSSHFPETDDRADLSAGLDALRRGSPQALTAESVKALQRHMGNGALQRLAGEEGFVGGPSLEADLEQEQGGGQSLTTPVRGEMEGAFGADFGAVRVHTDGKADELSRGLGAYAFAYGRDIYFADGEYAPATTSGQHLLAHELAHVVQQEAGAKLGVGGAHDPAEREADRAADEVVRAIRRGESALRRQVDPEEEEWEEVQMVRRQVELEEEEGFIHTLRRQVEPEKERLIQPVRRQFDDDGVARMHGGYIVQRYAVSKEELVEQLVRYGRFQLDSMLPQQLDAVNMFRDDLNTKVLETLWPAEDLVRGLGELSVLPGSLELGIKAQQSVDALEPVWMATVLADHAVWLATLAGAASGFSESIAAREPLRLDTDDYPTLEGQFWASFPAPSREDAFENRYSKLSQAWNASLAATQFFSQKPELAAPLFMSLASSPSRGGGE